MEKRQTGRILFLNLVQNKGPMDVKAKSILGHPGPIPCNSPQNQ